MYEKDELRSFASFATVLKILKRDPNFNKYCTQHRVPKGSTITLNKERKDCYLLESGYVKYDYTGSSSEGYYYVIPAGRFVSLPMVKNQFTLYARVTALTELVWWKIDVEFLRKMLQLEDPRNYVMLNYSIEVAYKLYIISKKYLLSAESRVYFGLLRCAEAGIKVADNQIELPSFLTYDLLAEFAGTSKGYTSTVLGELRDKGVLISSKKPWIITDLAWLKNILELEGLGDLN
ncbi:Crp/Fnr family transcriptional regulator [Listeria booriae]|uniref:Crp/Fnr family transcriptional regulator n=1 Tax=Listeria booriae TaxID=1552123 RepID=A0A7X0XTW2_9LIST|nr:Crp/Fnr family transcriptional regulator [Listeria booriae]MBC1575034.1 Crp/Fnr family transcriptional regulator [Listeria booriae]MBC1780005.1 Crp/Fnr family transcriptional regulator [Listeria booriae]MBC1919896.1 Crp/Fnr family transcriptional regulator [Listeria booriae]MBC2207716.1 Crp/Fnr family transcriptional regulator [Listeria booriae]